LIGIYWSDKCGREIPPNDPETGFYAGIEYVSSLEILFKAKFEVATLLYLDEYTP
jgi:hypothetical protein